MIVCACMCECVRVSLDVCGLVSVHVSDLFSISVATRHEGLSVKKWAIAYYNITEYGKTVQL